MKPSMVLKKDWPLAIHTRVNGVNQSIMDGVSQFQTKPKLLMTLSFFSLFSFFNLSCQLWQMIECLACKDLWCQISASATSVSTLSSDHDGRHWNYSGQPGVKWHSRGQRGKEVGRGSVDGSGGGDGTEKQGETRIGKEEKKVRRMIAEENMSMRLGFKSPSSISDPSLWVCVWSSPCQFGFVLGSGSWPALPLSSKKGDDVRKKKSWNYLSLF